MRQAQRIQQQMETVQASIAQKTIEATSGGGAVKVIVSGDGQLKSIQINPEMSEKSGQRLAATHDAFFHGLRHEVPVTVFVRRDIRAEELAAP